MKASEQIRTEEPQIEEVNSALEGLTAGERIQWIWETYGDRAVASTSFGLQAAVMLDLISKNAPSDAGGLCGYRVSFSRDLSVC